MRWKLYALIPLGLITVGCSTFTTPRYSINADTNVALKSLGVRNVALGDFTGPSNFSTGCRAAGSLAPPDGLTHTAYIRKALESELKVAGAHATATPSAIINGRVNQLQFSSTSGLTGGAWDIDLTLSSSNGTVLNVAERYLFESGFMADTACKQTAEAYFPAVQNLIAKVVQSPSFGALVR